MPPERRAVAVPFSSIPRHREVLREVLREIQKRLKQLTEALEAGEEERAYEISVELEVDVAPWLMNGGAGAYERSRLSR